MQQISFFKSAILQISLASICVFFSACEDDDPVVEDVPETITTTRLTFTPEAGGNALTFEATDPDGDGPESVSLDEVVLPANTAYTLTIEFFNELVPPTDEEYDITEEVEEEGDEHQIFFGWSDGLFASPTGDGNIGAGQQGDPVNYEDEDEDMRPIGLETTWTTGEAGSGNFQVILKHQPDIKSDTSGSTDGESDIDYTFDIEIQ